MAQRIAFISLGCPKNQVDCELMLSHACGAGFELTRRLEEADAIVVNTCSFIATAIAEADAQLREARRYKEHGRCRAIIVAGCLPQYLQERRASEYPFVDAWLTPDNPGDAGAVLLRLLAPDLPAMPGGRTSAAATEALPPLHLPRFLASSADGRVLSTPPSYAYIKIAEGCDHRCSFCIIPQLRGAYRSRPLSDIVSEARALLAQGIPELILVSQDCSCYGLDSGGPGLLELLAAICAIPGDFWLRVLYLYPREFADRELEAWARLGPKLLPYFDVPVQHVSPRLLRTMARDGDRISIDALFSRIKRCCPDAVLRTSLIAGFPGETEADFAMLLDWVQTGGLDRVGVFAYSDLPEMRSHHLPDHIPPELVDQRRLLLVQAHAAASVARAMAFTGRTLPAVLESRRRDPGGGGWRYVGRTWRDAPQIDGLLHLSAPQKCDLYKHCQVRITSTAGVDLTGVLAGD